MTRWLPSIALGLVVAVAAVTVVVAVQPGPEPTLAERAGALAGSLRCPDCQGLSVADSPTGSAQEIRRQVDELLAGGASDDEVRAHFVARYGEWILLAPASPVVWILPFVVVLGGGAILLAWLLRRRSADPSGPRPQLSEAERRRLRDEAEALDA
ncbi:MAG: cytochrome c-type biogenesis protein [Candidatus Limnocylindria bacterium]